MPAYYNEFDPQLAEWLRELMKRGLIPDGVVDERDIREVEGSDLWEFHQVHLFAGIAGWSHALQLAGWPEDRPVWTVSCPCQPFSVIGKRKGFEDERHLWPDAFRLITERRPDIIFGEQVESKDGRDWLSHVQADLEGSAYAVGAIAAPAAGFGAPHIRSRLYFSAVGDAFRKRLERLARDGDAGSQPGRFTEVPGGSAAEAGATDGLADANRGQREGRANIGGPESDGQDTGRPQEHGEPAEHGPVRGLANSGRPGPTNGYWGAADWLRCQDDKWRPARPGSFPLVNGTARGMVPGSDISLPTAEARKLRLHAYGNSIVTPQAAEFIGAVWDTLH